MMFEAIFLVAGNCTPMATKKEPNEPAEMYGPNEDESLSSYLETHTHTKEIKKEMTRCQLL